MSKIKEIFGIKESKQTLFVNPERQSAEQVEDYATKKVLQSKEIYLSDGAAAGFVKNDANGKLIGGQAGGGVSGLTTNVIPKAASSSTLADSSLTESATQIISTKDLLINDDGGIVISNSAGTATQPLTLKGVNDSATTANIFSGKHLVLASSSSRHVYIRAGAGQVATFLEGGQVFIAPSGTISASAMLQVDSTTKGFLPPRMTTTQKNAISSPATGLMVFDTTLGKVCVYTGAAWETMTSA